MTPTLRRILFGFQFTIAQLLASFYEDNSAGTLYADGAAGFTASASQYLSYSYSSDLGISAAGTLECWVQLTNTTGTKHILGVGDANNRVALYQNGATLRLFGMKASVQVFDIVSGTLSAGTWYHLVGKWDSSGASLYVNAASVGTPYGSNPALTLPASALIRIGASVTGVTNLLDGSVASAGVWSRAITAGEITSLYNSGAGKQFSGLTAGEKTSLVSFYNLNEHTGTRRDSIGTNHLAPSAGVSQTTGPGGSSAAQFTASASTALSVPSNSDFNFGAKFTLETWINPATAGVQQTIVSKWLASGQQSLSVPILTTNKVACFISPDGTDASSSLTQSVTVPTNSWTHVVIVYDGTQTGNANRLKLYVNSALDASAYNGTVPASMFNSTEAFRIGTVNVSGTLTNFFNGKMAPLRLWNIPLTAGNVTTLYNGGTPVANTNLGALATGLAADYEWTNAANLGNDSAGANQLTDITPAAVGFVAGIASAQVADGDPVSLLTDAVGSGGHSLTQATLVNRPFYHATAGPNGKPVLRFGGSHYLSKASVLGSTLFNSNECYIAAVLKQPTGAAGRNALFSWTDGTGASQVAVYSSFDGNIIFDFAYNAGVGRQTVAVPAGWATGFHLLECWRQADGTRVIAVDGVTLSSVVSSSAVDVTLSYPLMVGNFGSVFLSGDLAYLDISPTVPSAAVRAGFKAWVRSQFGLTIL